MTGNVSHTGFVTEFDNCLSNIAFPVYYHRQYPALKPWRAGMRGQANGFGCSLGTFIPRGLMSAKPKLTNTYQWVLLLNDQDREMEGFIRQVPLCVPTLP